MSSSDRVPYSYTVLRYVHDIGSDEFINVGVVLSAPRAQFTRARFKVAHGRVKKAFPTLDADAFRSRVKRLQTAFDRISSGDLATCTDDRVGGPRDFESLVRSVLRADDSSFQWSPTGNGISRDPAETLDALYTRLVAKYDSDASPARHDSDVWRGFKLELERRNVLAHLEAKVIEVSDDSVKFDHAWKNGAWHCYEPLSFDLATDASIREKAHRWVGQIHSIKDASESFKVYFLVGSPRAQDLAPAYQQALSILRKAPQSSVVEESSASAFSEAVAEAMRESKVDHV